MTGPLGHVTLTRVEVNVRPSISVAFHTLSVIGEPPSSIVTTRAIVGCIGATSFTVCLTHTARLLLPVPLVTVTWRLRILEGFPRSNTNSLSVVIFIV